MLPIFINLLSLLSVQDGDTALHWASYNGHKDTVELLVQKGAQVDSKNNVSIFFLRNLEKSIHTIVVTVISDNFPLVILD